MLCIDKIVFFIRFLYSYSLLNKNAQFALRKTINEIPQIGFDDERTLEDLELPQLKTVVGDRSDRFFGDIFTPIVVVLINIGRIQSGDYIAIV